jgi:hypothetical protein
VFDDAGGAGGAVADAGPTSGEPQTCTLQFQVTTVSGGSNYAPKNVGAIWISDAANHFVKSLTVWGRRRLSHLDTWRGVSGSNTVDAVTAATASSAGTRMAGWDCTDLMHTPVPDGSYVLHAEFTERNGQGPLMTPLPFTKGSGPVDLMPPNQTSFRNIHLQVGP